jgi:hypothetical protein
MKIEMQKICTLYKDTHGQGIKIMERGGRKGRQDIKSDPLGTKICEKGDCKICRAEGSKGGCRGQSQSYTQICQSCPHDTVEESSIYYGETGRSAYERGTEHTRDVRKEDENSPLWKHCEIVHGGEHVDFVMSVTGNFIGAEERQINEGAHVTESRANRILNSKSEWNQPPIFRIVIETGNSQEVQPGDVTGNRHTREMGRGRGRARGRGRGRGESRGRGTVPV